MSGIGKVWGAIGRAALVMVAGVTMAWGVASGSAAASALNLALQGTPEMTCDFIDLRYDADTGALTASGFAEDFTPAGHERKDIVNGILEISATLSSSGELKSGLLTVKGEIPSLGIRPGMLLTGKLSELGGEKDGPLELRFETSGGELSSSFGPTIKVIVSQSGFGGDFAQSFTSNSIAVAGIGW